MGHDDVRELLSDFTDAELTDDVLTSTFAAPRPLRTAPVADGQPQAAKAQQARAAVRAVKAETDVDSDDSEAGETISGPRCAAAEHQPHSARLRSIMCAASGGAGLRAKR